MLKNKVLVVIEGGQIQDIYTSGDTEVMIADYDNVDSNPAKSEWLQKEVETKISENKLAAINTKTGWNYLSDGVDYE